MSEQRIRGGRRTEEKGQDRPGTPPVLRKERDLGDRSEPTPRAVVELPEERRREGLTGPCRARAGPLEDGEDGPVSTQPGRDRGHGTGRQRRVSTPRPPP